MRSALLIIGLSNDFTYMISYIILQIVYKIAALKPIVKKNQPPNPIRKLIPKFAWTVNRNCDRSFLHFFLLLLANCI